MTCPHCESTATVERPDRTELGDRRFRCRTGKRGFNERTGTPDNRLQYPTEDAYAEEHSIGALLSGGRMLAAACTRWGVWTRGGHSRGRVGP
jgi:hypothetical protein